MFQKLFFSLLTKEGQIDLIKLEGERRALFKRKVKKKETLKFYNRVRYEGENQILEAMNNGNKREKEMCPG